MLIKSIGMILFLVSLLFLTTAIGAESTKSKSVKGVRGIYLTQYTLENTTLLKYLIKHAKAAGIDTFVIDMELPSKRYEQNIALVKENNIRYVARIIMFPNGATKEAMANTAIWQKKYALVKQAIEWGADEIQLDYIRYNTAQKPSSENAKNVMKVIQWFKNKLAEQDIPLQIDVFGITSFGESKYIGQNVKLFSESVDAICPMVYPSHYVPFDYHFKRPYETVYGSLQSIKKQFGEQGVPMKVYAYIELSNYHYPMSHGSTLKYIKEQIRAVDEAQADGWYAWSPHNRYDNLFAVLEGNNQETDTVKTQTAEKTEKATADAS
ncbi:MAG TPA: putative glycoside hydrolase [Gammaproteobacteria bacterium]|jgi:hypothetical protein|nr:putative glycoside hydrolase [Gammaproteobacteria bacterium]